MKFSDLYFTETEEPKPKRLAKIFTDDGHELSFLEEKTAPGTFEACLFFKQGGSEVLGRFLDEDEAQAILDGHAVD